MGKAKEKIEETDWVDNRKNGVVHPSVDEPMVECDFSRVSRRWGMDWQRIDGEFFALRLVLEADVPDDATDDQMRKIQMKRVEAHREQSALFELRNRLIAQVLVGVPADWLCDDAPAVDEIEWGS